MDVRGLLTAIEVKTEWFHFRRSSDEFSKLTVRTVVFFSQKTFALSRENNK